MTNKIKTAFESVEASEELKNSTLQYLQEERKKQDAAVSAKFFSFGAVPRNVFAAACVLLFFFIGAGGYYTIETPVSYVSIDVNPSIELSLNRFDRVVSAAAYNEDGEIVLNGLEVKGKPYTEAIDLIVESESMKPYLTESSELTFTVAADSYDRENTLLTGIENCSGSRKYRGQSYCTDVSTISEAHHNGMSFGKYAAYSELAEYDETVTVESCQKMTMGEIHTRIRAHENNSGSSGNGKNGGQHGNGESHGKHKGNGHH